LLGKYERSEKILCWCPLNGIHAVALIGISYEGGLFNLLEAPSAIVVHQAKMDTIIKSMAFDRASKLLFCADSEKQIIATEVNY